MLLVFCGRPKTQQRWDYYPACNNAYVLLLVICPNLSRWELYDSKSGRYYYFNAASQKTVWHRPKHVDVLPLSKLQKLKQEAEKNVSSKKTRHRLVERHCDFTIAL